MFKKIEQRFIKTDFKNWDLFESNNKIVNFDSSTGASLQYYTLNNFDKFRAIHSKKFCKIDPTTVSFAKIIGPGEIGPHTDAGVKVALNYYITAGTDETIFYKSKDYNINTIEYNSSDAAYTPNVYNADDLYTVGKFVAESGDAYILDVSQIHSVNKITNVPRMFIAYLWYNNSYDEILENLL